MKIAITSCGIFPDSPIDPRFGRCDYFVIVDTRDMSFEAIDNDSKFLSQGAGVKSAEFIASKGVQVVITGHVGPNAMRALSAAGVLVVLCPNDSIEEAVEKYQQGQLKSFNGANVRDHYGMVGKSAKEKIKRGKHGI